MAQSFILAAYITLPTSSRALHLNLSHTWWMWIPSILFGGYLMLLIRKTPADSPHEQGTGTLLPPFAPVSGYLHNSSHTLKNA